MRHVVQGEQAHLCEAQFSMIWTTCRSGSVSQRAIYLTKGDLGSYGLRTEKSAEAIVVNRNRGVTKRIKAQFSRVDEGLNIK